MPGSKRLTEEEIQRAKKSLESVQKQIDNYNTRLGPIDKFLGRKEHNSNKYQEKLLLEQINNPNPSEFTLEDTKAVLTKIQQQIIEIKSGFFGGFFSRELRRLEYEEQVMAQQVVTQQYSELTPKDTKAALTKIQEQIKEIKSGFLGGFFSRELRRLEFEEQVLNQQIAIQRSNTPVAHTRPIQAGPDYPSQQNYQQNSRQAYSADMGGQTPHVNRPGTDYLSQQGHPVTPSMGQAAPPRQPRTAGYSPGSAAQQGHPVTPSMGQAAPPRQPMTAGYSPNSTAQQGHQSSPDSSFRSQGSASSEAYPSNREDSSRLYPSGSPQSSAADTRGQAPQVSRPIPVGPDYPSRMQSGNHYGREQAYPTSMNRAAPQSPPAREPVSGVNKSGSSGGAYPMGSYSGNQPSGSPANAAERSAALEQARAKLNPNGNTANAAGQNHMRSRMTESRTLDTASRTRVAADDLPTPPTDNPKTH